MSVTTAIGTHGPHGEIIRLPEGEFTEIWDLATAIMDTNGAEGSPDSFFRNFAKDRNAASGRPGVEKAIERLANGEPLGLDVHRILDGETETGELVTLRQAGGFFRGSFDGANPRAISLVRGFEVARVNVSEGITIAEDPFAKTAFFKYFDIVTHEPPEVEGRLQMPSCIEPFEIPPSTATQGTPADLLKILSN